MKRQHTLAATLLIAALPIAAQASVASRQALEANHEPLARTASYTAQQETVHGNEVQHFSGSAAMIEAQQRIASLTDHRTNLTSENLPTEDDQPEIGHAADW